MTDDEWSWPSGTTVAGIDVGGSSSKVVTVVDGEIRTQYLAPGGNAQLSGDGGTTLERTVAGVAAEVVGVGLAGARGARVGADWARRLEAATGRRTVVVEDVTAALVGAFLGGPGVVVCAGTGSVALGWDGQRWLQAGGHGPVLGDEGGAYWVGRTWLRSLLQAADSGEQLEPEDDALRGAALAVLGVGDLDDAVRLVTTRWQDRSLLASLAPLVGGADTPLARTVLRSAGLELAALAHSLQGRLGPLPTAYAGGVFANRLVRDTFLHSCPARPAVRDAAFGAAMIAAGLPLPGRAPEISMP